jgi:tetratricopeptide (TPR) repeat protein
MEAARTADRLGAEGKQAAVHRIRGDILLTIRRNPSDAAMEYTRALSFEPTNPELMEKLAEADFTQGNMDGARKSAQNALNQNPHREVALGLLARVAMNERDYSTALVLLAQLAKMEPEDAWTRAQEGTAYAQTGHPAEAVERLKPLLDAGYPDEKGALHGLLAAQLMKIGRPAEAKIASDEAIRLADAALEHEDSK